MFYRIDDFGQLTGPRFIALALRVSAYQGVIAARMAEEMEPSTTTSRNQREEVKQVESTRVALAAEPAFAGGISWGEG